jgi:hypothetical protein
VKTRVSESKVVSIGRSSFNSNPADIYFLNLKESCSLHHKKLFFNVLQLPEVSPQPCVS